MPQPERDPVPQNAETPVQLLMRYGVYQMIDAVFLASILLPGFVAVVLWVFASMNVWTGVVVWIAAVLGLWSVILTYRCMTFMVSVLQALKSMPEGISGSVARKLTLPNVPHS